MSEEITGQNVLVIEQNGQLIVVPASLEGVTSALSSPVIPGSSGGVRPKKRVRQIVLDRYCNVVCGTNTDPCADVVCPPGYHCQDGVCVPDE